MPKLLIFFCLLPLALWAELEEFNLSDGRTLSAKIIEANDDKVVLERKDGLTFTLKPDAFVKADQAVIKEWRINQLLASGELFQLSGKATATGLKQQDEDGLILKEWTCYYTIIIKNATTLDLKDVTIEYAFTVKRDQLAKRVKDDEPLKPESYADTISIKDIAPRLPIAFDTKKVVLKSTELEEGWSWPGGGNQAIMDTLSPLTARVLFRDKVVAELTVAPTTPTAKSADAPTPPDNKD